jgi:hypothetical protein
LIQQNDDASSFFILDQGRMSVEIDGIVTKTITSGTGFG